MLKRISAVLIAGAVAGMMASGLMAATGTKTGSKMGATARQAPLARFSKALSLTPEQTQQVSVILQRLRTDVRAVAASDKTLQDKGTQVLQLRASAKDRIYGLLTIDQRNKADANRLVDKLLTPKRKGGLNQILARLNLSADQKTRIQSILQTGKTKAQAVRADTTLTREARKARMMDIHKETMNGVLAVLTPEQKAQFQQWMKNHGRAGHPGRV